MFNARIGTLLELAPLRATDAVFAAWTRDEYETTAGPGRRTEFEDTTRSFWSGSVVTRLDPVTGQPVGVPDVFSFETIGVEVGPDGVVGPGDHQIRRIVLDDRLAYENWSIDVIRRAVSGDR